MTPRAARNILLIGDITVLYATLVGALLLRGGGAYLSLVWGSHIMPFSVLAVVWFCVYYTFGLYGRSHFRFTLSTLGAWVRAFILNILAALLLFYLVPGIGITPKTTLFIFLVLYAALFVAWRRPASSVLGRWTRERVLVVAPDEPLRALLARLESGHSPVRIMRVVPTGDAGAIASALRETEANTVVFPSSAHPGIGACFCEQALRGIVVYDAVAFWEMYACAVPVSLLTDAHLLASFSVPRPAEAERLKRAFDIVGSAVGLLISLPIWLLIAVAVALDSRGSVFYKQERIGIREQSFVMWKFRTMTIDAEPNGPQWATEQDQRITRLGTFLRRTHLDELPQLLNILRGDMSFVGPRPERSAFVAELTNCIPFYRLRHIVRPGLTGWAQVQFGYASSVEDAAEKLGYDLYYVKRRSLALDAKILLKSLRLFLACSGR